MCVLNRYYAIFGMMANVALIFSGQYVKYVSSLRAGLPEGTDYWGHSLKLLMGAVLTGGGIVMALMAYMQNFVTYPTQTYTHISFSSLSTHLCSRSFSLSLRLISLSFMSHLS